MRGKVSCSLPILADGVVSGHHFSDGKMAFLELSWVGSHVSNLNFSSRKVSRDK